MLTKQDHIANAATLRAEIADCSIELARLTDSAIHQKMAAMLRKQIERCEREALEAEEMAFGREVYDTMKLIKRSVVENARIYSKFEKVRSEYEEAKIALDALYLQLDVQQKAKQDDALLTELFEPVQSVAI